MNHEDIILNLKSPMPTSPIKARFSEQLKTQYIPRALNLGIATLAFTLDLPPFLPPHFLPLVSKVRSRYGYDKLIIATGAAEENK